MSCIYSGVSRDTKNLLLYTMGILFGRGLTLQHDWDLEHLPCKSIGVQGLWMLWLDMYKTDLLFCWHTQTVTESSYGT